EVQDVSGAAGDQIPDGPIGREGRERQEGQEGQERPQRAAIRCCNSCIQLSTTVTGRETSAAGRSSIMRNRPSGATSQRRMLGPPVDSTFRNSRRLAENPDDALSVALMIPSRTW